MTLVAIRLALVACLVGVLTGCSQKVWKTFERGTDSTVAASGPVVNQRFSKVDLIELLVPDEAARKPLVDPIAADRTATEDEKAQRLLAQAYRKFNETGTVEQRKARRNHVQDAILVASEQNCAFYKESLFLAQAELRSFFGSATTVLGGLGAIFTSATTARALAGSAGISSGIGAELEEAYFKSLTIDLVTEGIDYSRTAVFNQIRASRDLGVDQYTVEHATLDAVRFHVACSLMSGLRTAGASVREIRHPGPETIKHVLSKVGEMRASLELASTGQPVGLVGSSPPVTLSALPPSASAAVALNRSGFDIAPQKSVVEAQQALAARLDTLDTIYDSRIRPVELRIRQVDEALALLKPGPSSERTSLEDRKKGAGAELPPLTDARKAIQEARAALVEALRKFAQSSQRLQTDITAAEIDLAAARDDAAKVAKYAALAQARASAASPVGIRFDKYVVEVTRDLAAMEKAAAERTRDKDVKGTAELLKKCADTLNLAAVATAQADCTRFSP